MGDHLWDLDKTDAGAQRVLSQKEQQFLMTGDSGSYTTAEMDRRVSAKAEKLPNRIQQLIDDISLLHYRGYLGEEVDPEIWEDLLAISNRSQAVRDAPIVRTANQHSGSKVNLGFEVGSLLRMIHDDPIPTDLAWGFIVGLIGEADDNWEIEAGNLVDLFGELEQQYEWRLVSAGAKAQEDDGFQEEREEIRELLHEHGFSPVPELVDVVLQEYTNDESDSLIENTEKSWRADPSQTEHPKPPDEMPSAEVMQRTNLQSIISKLDEQTRLRSIDRLAKDLKEDAIRIQRREWRGVNPDQAFRFIGENGETQIQEFEQTETKGQNNMTTALRKLSYEDSTWVNRPAIQENEGENMYWELTPYGRLLYSVRVEHDCSTNWMYNLIHEPERIDDKSAATISRVIQSS